MKVRSVFLQSNDCICGNCLIAFVAIKQLLFWKCARRRHLELFKGHLLAEDCDDDDADGGDYDDDDHDHDNNDDDEDHASDEDPGGVDDDDRHYAFVCSESQL